MKREPRTIFNAIFHGTQYAKDKLEAEFRPILLTSTAAAAAAPVPFVYTKHDLAHLELAGKRIMEVGRSDRELPACEYVRSPMLLHLAFWQAHWLPGLGLGTFMLSTGGGKTLGTEGSYRISLTSVSNWTSSVKGCPPSCITVLRQAMEEKRRWTNLKRITLGGEKTP